MLRCHRKHSVNTSYTCHSRMFLAGIQACADGQWIPDKLVLVKLVLVKTGNGEAFGNDTCPHGSGEWAVYNVFTECLRVIRAKAPV